MLSPPNKEVPVEEHNGDAHGEEDQAAVEEEEGEGVEADDEEEEEADEVTEDTLPPT